MKVVAVVQSNYIPWKGYFDLINMVDHFVLYDDVQYTRYNWRNRNKIKTRKGTQWLVIPISRKSLYKKIQEAQIDEVLWNKKHWGSIIHNYAKARYFRAYKDFFEQLYLGSQDKFLSDVNYRFLKAICDFLGIRTELSWSRDYNLVEGKIERVVDLCKQLRATEFLSGPTAKPYINEPLFTAAGIKIRWMDYSQYQVYNQLFCPPFIHQVSIIDLILNEGVEGAKKYMLSFKRNGDALNVTR